MVTLSRHSSRIYMDDYDVEGTMNALDHRVGNCSDQALPFYMGAYLALSIIYNQEELRDQSIFMDIFDNALRETGISLEKE